jgi:hypothetical protein
MKSQACLAPGTTDISMCCNVHTSVAFPILPCMLRKLTRMEEERDLITVDSKVCCLVGNKMSMNTAKCNLVPGTIWLNK